MRKMENDHTGSAMEYLIEIIQQGLDAGIKADIAK